MLRTVRLLVTGFGSFRGIVDNPSDRLARAMLGLGRPGLEVHVASPLPVEFGRAAAIAIERARSVQADGVLALGLARSATRLRIESTARRDPTSGEPDETGAVAPRSLDGPPSLLTPIDVPAVIRALGLRGVDASPSEDAGGYVCNDLYYRLLHAEIAPTLFVHVPDLPEALGHLPEALLEAFVDVLAPR
jgi:pyroglutamyl-peptidase